MNALSPLLISLAAALGLGLLVGLERERRHPGDSTQTPAGLRTFTVVALLGWCAQLLAWPGLLPGLLVALAVLLAVAYWRSEREDRGLTTEVALLLVLLLGAVALARPALATALGVVLASLLFYRDDLHRFVRAGLSQAEIRDGLILAAAALVILPMVPDAFVGPLLAINLRTVWLLVVLMMAIGAIGHLAIRLAGPRFGLPLAGFIAGFASSTATVASMGDYARRQPAMRRPAVSAAVMSTVATMVLMVLVLAAVDMRVMQALLLPLLVAALVTLAYAAWGFMRKAELPPALDGRVFDWRLALGAAAAFAGVQFLAALLYHWLGEQGVLLATALAGFGDTHAAAASAATLVQSGKLEAAAVELPILAALSSNSLSKLVMAFISGGRAYALAVLPGLLLPLLAMWGWWVLV